MKIRYIGPHDAVEVADSEGRAFLCDRDQALELPDELAKSLLKQETWASAEAKKPEPKKEGK